MPETVCDGEPTAPSRAPVPHASWELPAEPATVGSIRAGVRDFARAHGLGAPHVADLALAVTEAVTNCVVHAFVGREPGTVRTAIQAGAGELVVTVVDDGRGMQPRADSPGLGLGLPTIASLTTLDGHARAAGRRDGADDDLLRAHCPRAGAHVGARGRAARPGRAHRRGHLAGGGGGPARGPARPRARRRLRAGRDGRLGAPAALRGPHRRPRRRQPVGLAGSAQAAHGRPAVRGAPGAGRRQRARRRAHARAHRPDHLQPAGRRADGGHGRALVGGGAAERRRAPARPARLRPARRARGAVERAAGDVPRRRRSCRPRAAHHPADLRPAPDAGALRAHPGGARRGRDRPGRRRPHGLREHGGGAARRLRDAGGAAGDAGRRS